MARRSATKSAPVRSISGPTKKQSMEIRQIENGFIIRREQQGKNGEWIPPKEEYVRQLPRGLVKK